MADGNLDLETRVAELETEVASFARTVGAVVHLEADVAHAAAQASHTAGEVARLDRRLQVVEQLIHRLLPVVGAAGAMLAEVRNTTTRRATDERRPNRGRIIDAMERVPDNVDLVEFLRSDHPGLSDDEADLLLDATLDEFDAAMKRLRTRRDQVDAETRDREDDQP